MRLVGPELRQRHHAAQIGVPERTWNRVLVGCGRPEEQLQHVLDSPQDEFLLLPGLASCKVGQPLEVAPERPFTKILDVEGEKGDGASRVISRL